MLCSTEPVTDDQKHFKLHIPQKYPDRETSAFVNVNCFCERSNYLRRRMGRYVFTSNQYDVTCQGSQK